MKRIVDRIRDLRVGNIARERTEGGTISLDQKHFDLYRHGLLECEGLTINDKNLFYCGEFEFVGYDNLGNGVYVLDNPDSSYLDDPPLLSLVVEDTEGHDIFIDPYKYWILKGKKKIMVSYVHELQNYISDKFGVQYNWGLV